jgi:hypothetical protein
MTQNFRFRSPDTVGVADAESDRAFLKECFIDTGQLGLLSDCADHRRIIGNFILITQDMGEGQ